MKIKKSHLKELVKQHIKENWWDMLEPDEQAAYIKAHPKSQKAQDAKKKMKKSDDEPRAATPATDKDDARPTKNPFSKEFPELGHNQWNKKAKKAKAIDSLNKKAQQGNGDLIDTEHNGMLTWEEGDPDEDSFMAIDQDGETVELDYTDIIRFHNDDESETKLKSVQESINESRGRRCTVKEIKKWFKSLEENRYKKTYNSDARRVSWLVNNNLSEDYDTMPTSMRKKWSKAAYGRERYLAKEFIKHLDSKQITEQKLRMFIRKVIKEQLNEGPRDFIHHSEAKFIHILKKDVKKAQKLLKKFKWQVEIQPKPSRKVPGHYAITTTKKMYNKVLEVLVKNNINPRG